MIEVLSVAFTAITFLSLVTAFFHRPLFPFIAIPIGAAECGAVGISAGIIAGWSVMEVISCAAGALVSATAVTIRLTVLMRDVRESGRVLALDFRDRVECGEMSGLLDGALREIAADDGITGVGYISTHSTGITVPKYVWCSVVRDDSGNLRAFSGVRLFRRVSPRYPPPHPEKLLASGKTRRWREAREVDWDPSAAAQRR